MNHLEEELGAARAFVDGLATSGMRFGLERIEGAMEALGRPERSLRTLHIAGTNGKGSTCAFAAALLSEMGLKVGLYTSPHLVRPGERIQVAGRELSERLFAKRVAELLSALPEGRVGGEQLSYFEFETTLALHHFAKERVDLAILEAGLGGRLDATNVCRPEVAAITRIGLDHVELLGGTIEAIAREKAGILKAGAAAVIARQPSEALAALERAAEARGIGPFVAGRDFYLAEEPLPPGDRGASPPEEGTLLSFFAASSPRAAPRLRGRALRLGLLGPYQRENAETALMCAILLAPELGEETLRAGVAKARWPGRLERIAEAPLTLLDGAHNADGARALAEALRALYPERPLYLLFGALADKDVRAIAAHLFPLAKALHLAAPRSERALPLDALEALAREHGLAPRIHASIGEGVDAARAHARAEGGERPLVLIAGSLYLIGDARAHLLD